MGRANVGQNGESSSGSRLTRSHLQAGPLWTLQDMLILVNEIAAVELDCQDALSSYQKWAIIAENCTALEVVRNSNQCRRKWESLLADYNTIKEFESSSRRDSYWSLECERRQKNGLPVDFDKDLFRAIDDFTKATEKAETDVECDSEDEMAEVDVLNTGTFGSKPKRVINQARPQKNRSIRRKQLALKEEHVKPVRIIKDMEQIMATKLEENMKTGPKPKRIKLESTLQRSSTNERKEVPLKDEPEKPFPFIEDKVLAGKVKRVPLEEEIEKPMSFIEDKKQILAGKVKEKTELIHAILAGVDNNAVDEKICDVSDEETLKSERVKLKADKLIACLADLAKNLEQLCDVVKEC